MDWVAVHHQIKLASGIVLKPTTVNKYSTPVNGAEL